jgi:hypothetical protein
MRAIRQSCVSERVLARPWYLRRWAGCCLYGVGMADAIAVAVSIAFLVVVAIAMGKPFLHALHLGSQPTDRPDSPALRLEDSPPWEVPPQDDEGGLGVREPRRPNPSGSAGEVALEPEASGNVGSAAIASDSVATRRSVREHRAA